MDEKDTIQFVIDEDGNKLFLEKEIGRGGQGIVWRTSDPNIIVKMKINKSTGQPVVDEKEYEKYKDEMDEVRIMNIPDFIHIAKPASMLRKPYCGYIMRFLDGMKPIKHWIRSFDEPDINPVIFYYQTGGLRHRLELLTNLAEIFTKLFAHSAVYADLSPNNVFASENMDSSEVWLIDADNMRYRYDMEKEISTEGYTAPEVVKGGINTLESDEYSFAILAHEILTLNSPFDGEMVTESDAGWDDEEEDASVLAQQGEIPWIEDPEDDRNRCSTGIPGKIAFTRNVRNLFERTFSEEGRHNPLSRPKMRDWYTALKQAQDYTVTCKYCKSTFLMTKAEAKCPFCKTGRTSEREKVIYSQIIDEYRIDEIIENENQHIDSFNNDEYFVQGISKDDIKRIDNIAVKLFDMKDGKYCFYNYHTDDVSFSQKKMVTIELEIAKGIYTIRNMAGRDIEISSSNTSYGVIRPEESKKFESINNLILSFNILKKDKDMSDEEIQQIDDLNKIRKRHIKFYVI